MAKPRKKIGKKIGKRKPLSAAARAKISRGLARALGPTRGLDPYEPVDRKPGEGKKGKKTNPGKAKRSTSPIPKSVQDIDLPDVDSKTADRRSTSPVPKSTADKPTTPTGKKARKQHTRDLKNEGWGGTAEQRDKQRNKDAARADKDKAKAERKHIKELERAGFGEKGEKRKAKEQARAQRKAEAAAELSDKMKKGRDAAKAAAKATPDVAKAAAKDFAEDFEYRRNVLKDRSDYRRGRTRSRVTEEQRVAARRGNITENKPDDLRNPKGKAAQQAAQQAEQKRQRDEAAGLNAEGRRQVTKPRQDAAPNRDANPNGQSLGDPNASDEFQTPQAGSRKAANARNAAKRDEAAQRRRETGERAATQGWGRDPQANTDAPNVQVDDQRPTNDTTRDQDTAAQQGWGRDADTSSTPNRDVAGGGHQASADYLEDDRIRGEKRYRKDLADKAAALDGNPAAIEKARQSRDTAARAAAEDTGNARRNRQNARRAARKRVMLEDLGVAEDGQNDVRRPDDADTHAPTAYDNTVDGDRPIHRTTAAEQQFGADSPEAAEARAEHGDPGTDAVNPADRGLPTATPSTNIRDRANRARAARERGQQAADAREAADARRNRAQTARQNITDAQQATAAREAAAERRNRAQTARNNINAARDAAEARQEAAERDNRATTTQARQAARAATLDQRDNRRQRRAPSPADMPGSSNARQNTPAPQRDAYDDLADQAADQDTRAQFADLTDDDLHTEQAALLDRWDGDLADFTPEGATDEMNLAQVRADRQRVNDITDELDRRNTEGSSSRNTGTDTGTDNEAFQALTDTDMPHDEGPTSSRGLLDSMDDDDLAELAQGGPLAVQARAELGRRNADRADNDTRKGANRTSAKHADRALSDDIDRDDPAVLAAMDADRPVSEQDRRTRALHRDLPTMDDDQVRSLANNGDDTARALANEELDARDPFRDGGALDQRAAKFTTHQRLRNWANKKGMTREQEQELTDLGARNGNKNLYLGSTYADQRDGDLASKVPDERTRDAIDGLEHDDWDALRDLADRAYGEGAGRDKRGESDRDAHAEEALTAMFDDIGYVPNIHNFIRTSQGLPPEGPRSVDDIREHFAERRRTAVNNATGERGKRLTPAEKHARDTATGMNRGKKWVDRQKRSDNTVTRRLADLEAGKAGSPLKPDVHAGEIRAVKDEAMRRGLIAKDADYKKRHPAKRPSKPTPEKTGTPAKPASAKQTPEKPAQDYKARASKARAATPAAMPKKAAAPAAPAKADTPKADTPDYKGRAATARQATTKANLDRLNTAAQQARADHRAATPDEKPAAEVKWRKAELAHAEAEAAANPGSRNHARNVQSKKKRLDNSQARLAKAQADNKPTPKAKAKDTPDYRQRAAKARSNTPQPEPTPAEKAPEAPAKAQDPTKPSGEGKPLTFRQFVAEKRRAASEKYDLSAAEAAQELPESQFNAEYRDYLKKSFDQGADIPARHWNTLDEGLQRNLLRTPRALKDDSLTRKYRDMSRAKQPDAPKGVYDNNSVNSPDTDAPTPKAAPKKAAPKADTPAEPKKTAANRPQRLEAATADTRSRSDAANEKFETLNKDPKATKADKAQAIVEMREAELEHAKNIAEFWQNERNSAEVQRRRHGSKRIVAERQRILDTARKVQEGQAKRDRQADLDGSQGLGQRTAEADYQAAVEARNNAAEALSRATSEPQRDALQKGVDKLDADLAEKKALAGHTDPKALEKAEAEVREQDGSAEYYDSKAATQDRLADKAADDPIDQADRKAQAAGYRNDAASRRHRAAQARLQQELAGADTTQAKIDALKDKIDAAAKDSDAADKAYQKANAAHEAEKQKVIDRGAEHINNADKSTPSARRYQHLTDAELQDAHQAAKAAGLFTDLGGERGKLESEMKRRQRRDIEGVTTDPDTQRRTLTVQDQGRDEAAAIIYDRLVESTDYGPHAGDDNITVTDGNGNSATFGMLTNRNYMIDPGNGKDGFIVPGGDRERDTKNIALALRRAGFPTDKQAQKNRANKPAPTPEQDAPSLDGAEGLRTPQANSSDYMSMKPAERDVAVYDLVQNADGNTTRDFMDATGMSRSSTLAALKRLEARGLLNRESQSGGTREGISGGRGAVNEDLAWRPAHVIDEDDQAAEVQRLLADHKAGKKIDQPTDTPDAQDTTPAQAADEWAATVAPEALASRAQTMTDLNKSLNAGGHHRERALQIITNEPDAYGKDEAEFNERRKAANRRLNTEKKAAQQRNADAHAAALTDGIPADATRADLMELRATNRKAMKDTNSATAEHGRLERLARRIDDQIKALDKADAAERKAQQAAKKELDLKGVKARGIRNSDDITAKTDKDLADALEFLDATEGKVGSGFSRKDRRETRAAILAEQARRNGDGPDGGNGGSTPTPAPDAPTDNTGATLDGTQGLRAGTTPEAKPKTRTTPPTEDEAKATRELDRLVLKPRRETTDADRARISELEEQLLSAGYRRSRFGNVEHPEASRAIADYNAAAERIADNHNGQLPRKLTPEEAEALAEPLDRAAKYDPANEHTHNGSARELRAAAGITNPADQKAAKANAQALADRQARRNEAADDPDTDVIIEHDEAGGTTLEMADRPDEATRKVLKAQGYKWSRNLGQWYKPRSRDKAADTYKIDRNATALENAGLTVGTRIDNTVGDANAREARKQQRAEERAEALAAKADRKAAKADAAEQAQQEAVERLPWGGEPIKIGHHSQRAHERAHERANRADRKAWDARAESNYAAGRAAAAARSATNGGDNEAPSTTYNRIQKLEADIRSMERRNLSDYGKADLQQKKGDLEVSKARRAQQIADGKVIDPTTVSKGDKIKARGTTYTVTRVNKNTFSVQHADGRKGTIPHGDAKAVPTAEQTQGQARSQRSHDRAIERMTKAVADIPHVTMDGQIATTEPIKARGIHNQAKAVDDLMDDIAPNMTGDTPPIRITAGRDTFYVSKHRRNGWKFHLNLEPTPDTTFTVDSIGESGGTRTDAAYKAINAAKERRTAQGRAETVSVAQQFRQQQADSAAAHKADLQDRGLPVNEGTIDGQPLTSGIDLDAAEAQIDAATPATSNPGSRFYNPATSPVPSTSEVQELPDDAFNRYADRMETYVNGLDTVTDELRAAMRTIDAERRRRNQGNGGSGTTPTPTSPNLDGTSGLRGTNADRAASVQSTPDNTAAADDLARTPSSVSTMSPAQFRKWDEALEGMDLDNADWYTNEVHKARYARRGTEEDRRSNIATTRARNAAPKFREWTSRDGSETRQYISNWKGMVGIRRGGGSRQSPRYYYPGGESAGTMERAGAYVDADGRVHITGVTNSDAHPDRKQDMQLALQAAVNKDRGTNARPYGRAFDEGDYPETDGVPAPGKTPETPNSGQITPDSTRMDVQTKYQGKTLDNGQWPTADGIRAMADYLSTNEGRKHYNDVRAEEMQVNPEDRLDANTITAMALSRVAYVAGVNIVDITNASDNTQARRLSSKKPETLARNLADMLDVDLNDGPDDDGPAGGTPAPTGPKTPVTPDSPANTRTPSKRTAKAGKAAGRRATGTNKAADKRTAQAEQALATLDQPRPADAPPLKEIEHDNPTTTWDDAAPANLDPTNLTDAVKTSRNPRERGSATEVYGAWVSPTDGNTADVTVATPRAVTRYQITTDKPLGQTIIADPDELRTAVNAAKGQPLTVTDRGGYSTLTGGDKTADGKHDDGGANMDGAYRRFNNAANTSPAAIAPTQQLRDILDQADLTGNGEHNVALFPYKNNDRGYLEVTVVDRNGTKQIHDINVETTTSNTMIGGGNPHNVNGKALRALLGDGEGTELRFSDRQLAVGTEGNRAFLGNRDPNVAETSMQHQAEEGRRNLAAQQGIHDQVQGRPDELQAHLPAAAARAALREQYKKNDAATGKKNSGAIVIELDGNGTATVQGVHRDNNGQHQWTDAPTTFPVRGTARTRIVLNTGEQRKQFTSMLTGNEVTTIRPGGTLGYVTGRGQISSNVPADIEAPTAVIPNGPLGAFDWKLEQERRTRAWERLEAADLPTANDNARNGLRLDGTAGLT